MEFTKKQLEIMRVELEASFDARAISEEEYKKRLANVTIAVEIMNVKDSGTL